MSALLHLKPTPSEVLPECLRKTVCLGLNMINAPEQGIPVCLQLSCLKSWWCFVVPSIRSESPGILFVETMILDASWNQPWLSMFPLPFALRHRFIVKGFRSGSRPRDLVGTMSDGKIKGKPKDKRKEKCIHPITKVGNE